MNTAKIPVNDYSAVAKQFNPTNFDADAYVGLTKAAGVKDIDLDDFSQNFFVNNQVKVTFFCPDAPERKILSQTSGEAVRVCVLMKHGFLWKDFYAVFVRTENEGQCDFAADRLPGLIP